MIFDEVKLAGYPRTVQIVRGRRAIAPLGRKLGGPAVAIGNFDGVHLGHQALLREARRLAQASGAEVVALTFDPHPARFFAPDLAPPMLTTLERRAELLGEAGADTVLIEPFTAELAGMTAEAFVEQVLAHELGARHVVVGSDFSFGKNRLGKVDLLCTLGQRHGIGVSVIPQVSVNAVPCSSTKIREFVLEGRVEGARMLLGRPFEIEGDVGRGFGRGRTLGAPTANITNAGEILPRAGVYAGQARRMGALPADERDQVWYPAAISIGTNPTFADQGDPQLLVEAYLLDFQGDLYGARLRLAFLAHLREQRRFAAAEDLADAIKQDISRVREICTDLAQVAQVCDHGP
ncbi:MAG: bifunctional riboflavin kinase/FAD synthetase [Polyangia bacterium]